MTNFGGEKDSEVHLIKIFKHREQKRPDHLGIEDPKKVAHAIHYNRAGTSRGTVAQLPLAARTE